ncbi:MAG: PIN domain-containing protein [Acidobacteriota bacterium]|nr:PIN domain-containing protein [Acidobacteriota bacterium]
MFDRRDSHHRRAQRVALEVVSRAHAVTHDAVLTEVLAYFSEAGAASRQVAVEGVKQAVRAYEVLPADRALFVAGLHRYAERPDKEWSHVDCMSMVLMEQRGIRHVLTNDHHFAQAGFVVVNE